MAIGQVKESVEVKKTLYTGVASVKVVAVNPSAADLKKFMGINLENEVNYEVELDGVKSRKIAFLCKMDNEIDTETFVTVNYYLGSEPVLSQDGKFQIVNQFGDFAWATPEEFAAKKLSEKMSWYNLTGIRQAMRGEEGITTFIKTLYNIGKVEVGNESASYCQFDNLKKIYDGNIKELTDAIKGASNQKIKLLLGVKTSTKILDDGKERTSNYQDVFTKAPMREWITNYQKTMSLLDEAKRHNMFGSTDFGNSSGQLVEWSPSTVATTNAVNPEPEGW